MGSSRSKCQSSKPRLQTVSRMGLPNGDVRTWDLANWPVAEAMTADGEGDCSACKGRCCTYVTVCIDKPKRRVDRDEIRWFLAHENIQVFVEDKEWYVQFLTRCKHLGADGMCGIYEDRFDVCREHKTEECEMSEGEVDSTVFTTTEEFNQWWERKKQKKREKKRRRKNDAAG